MEEVPSLTKVLPELNVRQTKKAPVAQAIDEV